jgi:beta-glucanase (GH16 family)
MSRRRLMAAVTASVVAAALSVVAPPATVTGTGPAVAQAAAPRPYGVAGTWKMTFWEGFGGKSLNLNHWRPNWLAASDRAITRPVNKREHSCYDPRNVSVANGSLRLKAEKRRCRAQDGSTWRYASGLVESRHDFRFTYGYAEARIYLPPNRNRSKGPLGSCAPNWGAFWLNGDNWPADGEIDIMECLGDNVGHSYHWSGGSSNTIPRAWRGDMPGRGGWHTFGVDWRPGSLTYYYDGRVVGRRTTGITNKPHYIILNLGLSGDTHQLPQTMKVSYVRVWQRSS